MSGRKVNQTLADAFGQVLRQLRNTHNLTQEELAEKAAFHRTYVGYLEQGRRQPSLKVVMDLAKALAVAPEDIVRRVNLLLYPPPSYTEEDSEFLMAADETKPFSDS